MPYILRIVRKNRWYSSTNDTNLWTEKGDAPADTLGDLATRNNELSVWRVDNECSNLNRLVAALAANRERLDKLDYLLFSPEILEQAGIDVAETNGLLPDDYANQWHLALKNISVKKIASLAVYAWHSPHTITRRVLKKETTNLVMQAIENKHLPLTKLNSKLRSEVEKKLNL